MAASAAGSSSSISKSARKYSSSGQQQQQYYSSELQGFLKFYTPLLPYVALVVPFVALVVSSTRSLCFLMAKTLLITGPKLLLNFASKCIYSASEALIVLSHEIVVSYILLFYLVILSVGCLYIHILHLKLCKHTKTTSRYFKSSRRSDSNVKFSNNKKHKRKKSKPPSVTAAVVVERTTTIEKQKSPEKSMQVVPEDLPDLEYDDEVIGDVEDPVVEQDLPEPQHEMEYYYVEGEKEVEVLQLPPQQQEEEEVLSPLKIVEENDVAEEATSNQEEEMIATFGLLEPSELLRIMTDPCCTEEYLQDLVSCGRVTGALVARMSPKDFLDAGISDADLRRFLSYVDKGDCKEGFRCAPPPGFNEAPLYSQKQLQQMMQRHFYNPTNQQSKSYYEESMHEISNQMTMNVLDN